jgi:cobalt-zinc-cadmium efflux system membrane fusion protein
MKIAVRWPSRMSLALALLALAACSTEREASTHDANHPEGAESAAEADGHEEAGSDALDLAGVRGVTFAPVGEPREEGAWFAAEAIADPGAVAVVSTPVAGRLMRLRATPGMRVAAGAPIAELESAELADLGAGWISASARSQRAARDVERERRLLAAGATARRDVEAAEAEAAVAAADLEAARLALAGRGLDPASVGARLVVRAPRAGTLAAYEAAVGETVAAGARLATIVSAGAARVQVELPLPGPQAWSTGAATEVRRSDGRVWSAVVEGIPPALSPATRRLTYLLRLADRAEGELPLAGTPLEVRVPLALAVVLPQEALQQIEGVWGVFVRAGESAELRAVRKGPELGGDVMVLDGVAPGEIVATDGAYLLKALWLKRAGGDEGHDH